MRRTSKYGNQKIEVNGQVFDSKREARRYAELIFLVKAGEIDELRTQVPFELVPKQTAPDGHAIRAINYVADFVYIDVHNGDYIVEDAKGFQTPEYKIKKKLMYHKYGIWIREV